MAPNPLLPRQNALRSRSRRFGGPRTWAKEYMRLVLRERGADHAWMTTGPWPSPSGAGDPIRPRLAGLI